MPVFYEQELIHIHNPRCAGTTINRALAKCLNIPAEHFSSRNISYHYLYGNHRIGDNKYELDHLTFSLLHDAVPSWVSNHFKSFVVVRHPWDRFTSEYTRKVSTGCRRFINHKNFSFEQYCLKFIRICRNRFDADFGFQGMSHFQSCHFLPQYFYTGSKENTPHQKPQIIQLDEINQKLPQLLTPEHSGHMKDLLAQGAKNSHRSIVLDDVRKSVETISSEVKAKVEKFYQDDYRILNFRPYSKFALGD